MRKLTALVLAFGLGVASLSMTAQAGALPTTQYENENGPTLSPLLEQVSDAVVNIAVKGTQKVQNPLFNDPFFRRFFNVPEGHLQERKIQAAGSGVIIDADKGIVITNHHVVKDADEIKVSLNDGRVYEAKLLGADPEVDIAVLEIEADNLKALKIADSDRVKVGDYVVAIGNPFGLNHTVTTGIVSALGRSGLGIEGYENFIQTDASINPGNSGGALINMKGRLIGVNTAILAPSGGNVGIGFAIPSNMVKATVNQILEYGEVKRALLGVVIQDLNPDLAEAFGLDNGQKGVVISDVQEGSAAEKAGLKTGDVILELDGKPVKSSGQLRARIGLKRAGTEVALKILRDGDEMTVKARLGGKDSSASSSDEGGWFSKWLDGVKTDALKGVQMETSEDPEGVRIVDLKRDSKAAAAGLRPGDVIVEVNRERVRSTKDLKKALKKSDDKTLLLVVRNGGSFYVVIR
ncbi:MAG: DegQ family serine endoprotease [Gammaproteobacteria bacterium]|nr:MAG: DegQ family serine endoprotease [Gammaproteobacteria bacterium]